MKGTQKTIAWIGLVLLSGQLQASCPHHSKCKRILGHYQCVANNGFVYAHERGFISADALEILRLEGLLIKYTSMHQPGFYKNSYCSKKKTSR